MTKNYIYESTRIRIKELSLLSDYDKKYLDSFSTTSECLEFLTSSKGWGYDYDYTSCEKLMRDEIERNWKFVLSLIEDKKLFAAILCQNDYENLKICIKSIMQENNKNLSFVSDGLISSKIINKSVKENNYSELPSYMRDAASEGMKTLLETGDGQLLDIILDKSLASAMNSFAKESECKVIKYYTKIAIVCANIRIVLRGASVSKSVKFLKDSCLPCCDLDIDKLVLTGINGKKQLCEYLKFTDYSEGAEFLSESLASFEKWCDDAVAKKAKEERNAFFTISPIVSYILAKINETRVAKMIILPKYNDIPNVLLKQRMRRMYA